MSVPPALGWYRGLTRLAASLVPTILVRRTKAGKEDPERRHERLGRPTEPRPDGTLVWMHGASVGESLVLATLVDELSAWRPDLHFLVTTGTMTSAKLLAKRLPERARHQYVPVDTPSAVSRFLDHWRPDLSVFAESEIWPNLITATADRGIPMALVNARMNEKSLRNWNRRADTARYLLGCFDWIGAADTRTRDGLEDLLGKPVELSGNLKLEAAPAPPSPRVLSQLRVDVAGRPVWLAASTHEGEEEIILDAHRELLGSHPYGLLILAPRHPERGDAIAQLLKRRHVDFARRSKGEIPATKDTVWLADTLGEMPLWFAIARAAFIAGSLQPDIGGHNPVEASQAGCSVITGPHVASFEDLYRAYRKHSAMQEAGDARSIAAAVDRVWKGDGPPASNADAALREASGGALEITVDALTALLPEATSGDPGDA